MSRYGAFSTVLTFVIIPLKLLGKIVLIQLLLQCIGITPNGAGIRYTADIVGWNIPALYVGRPPQLYANLTFLDF